MTVLGPVDHSGIGSLRDLDLSATPTYVNPNGFLLSATGAGNVTVMLYYSTTWQTFAIAADRWLTLGGVFLLVKGVRATNTTATGLKAGANWDAELEL